MKMTMTILLLLITLQVSAPKYQVLYIEKGKAIHPYERLWNAVCMVESQRDSSTCPTKTNYNIMDPNGGSHGISQIGLAKLSEYNNLTGKHYTVQDLYKVGISKEIFMFYVTNNLEMSAKKWNGSGKMTILYWERIKQYL